jgi:uncharacterized membrane protein (UPF0127 family)
MIKKQKKWGINTIASVFILAVISLIWLGKMSYQVFFRKPQPLSLATFVEIWENEDKVAFFDVEIASTSAQQAKGLMYRRELAEDKGMLFVFSDEAPRSFWMKNTYIPLDIIFISADKKIINIEKALPCETDICPHYASQGPAQYVLEINGGLSEKLGIKPSYLLSFRE